MMFGKKGWIGIDIGTHSVKYAQVEYRGRQIGLSAVAIVPRPVPVDHSMWLRSPPVSSAIEFETAMKSARFAGRQAACTSPISVCDARTIDVEGDTRSDQRASIEQQLSSIHGVPSENLDFDFWDSPGLNPNQFHVICMADRWTKQILRDHQQAKLYCKVLDGLPQALARAASMSNRIDSSKPVALLDWGSSTATFCVSINEQPVYVRSLPNCGFAKLEERIASVLDLDEAQARNFISSYGVPDDPENVENEMQQVLDDILCSQIIELEEELTRTITFLKNQQGRIKLQQGLIFGAGARLKNVAAWLGTRLGLSLRTWSLPGQNQNDRSDDSWPMELLGPAVALSSLALETP